ncbi:hypothetical protein PVAND_017749, partial [Polypedilum vanderplanki]
MEVLKTASKRDNCSAYYVEEIDQLYLAKKGSNFLQCYFFPCTASGQLVNGQFFECEYRKTHSNHNSGKSQYNYFLFWNELKCEVKRGLKNNKIIFEDIYNKHRENIFPIIVSYESISSTLRKMKSKCENYLPTPHSVNEIIQYLPPNSKLLSITSLNGRQMIHNIQQSCLRAGQNIAIFDESFLQEISQISDMAFIDSTFQYFPSIFQQLMIIHMEVKEYTFVVAMILMTRKTYEAYDDCF